MNTRLLLPVAFLGLFACGVTGVLDSDDPHDSEVKGMASIVSASAPGVFPAKWINGDDESEPATQIHAYNEDTYILRQSKFETYEAPFLFLLFGDEKALLMDTGSNPDTPLAEPVEGIVREWLARNNRESIDLIVQHTHGHGDHVQGDSQMRSAAFVSEVVSTRQRPFEESWGFTNYPEDVPSIDLGGRIIDVLGTPGHHPASVTLYDRETQLLLTGDIVYPGHLFIFSPRVWPDFVDSIQRLSDWADTHPISKILGCHIETSAEPYSPFAYGTMVHPNEHVLELESDVLAKLLAAAKAMGDKPQYEVLEEVVIHPVYLNSIEYNGEE
jgi:hydroxyacylglutathione hydrolase